MKTITIHQHPAFTFLDFMHLHALGVLGCVILAVVVAYTIADRQ